MHRKSEQAASVSEGGPRPPISPAILSAAEALRGVVQEQPFKHWVLHDIWDGEFLRECRSAVLSQGFNEKNNDLYQFKQSDSLTSASTPPLSILRDTLYSAEFVSWMSTITGISLNDTVDISSAVYDDTSYLLCHDDDLSGRRIAFIIYLVPPIWSASMGGTLDLYAAEADGSPGAIVKSIVPRFNTMAFFEVSTKSFHQVAEVLASVPGGRASISGWFHGPPLAAKNEPPLPVPAPIMTPWHPDDADNSDSDSDSGGPCSLPSAPLVLAAGAAAATPTPPHATAMAKNCLAQWALQEARGALHTTLHLYASSEDAWSHWIHPNYTSRGKAVLSQMSLAFNSSGFLQLPDFLAPGPLKEVMCALPLQQWQHVGPAQLQHFRRSSSSALAFRTEPSQHPAYDVQALGTAFSAVQQLELFFGSAAFVEFISGATGQTVRGVSLETRAFGHRDYTMICDPAYLAQRKAAKAARLQGTASSADAADDSESSHGEDVVLEVVLCLPAAQGSSAAQAAAGDSEWPLSAGGYMTYLTVDEEVLTVPVSPNSLSVVAKPAGVFSFVKYVNHTAPGLRFDVAVNLPVLE